MGTLTVGQLKASLEYAEDDVPVMLLGSTMGDTVRFIECWTWERVEEENPGDFRIVDQSQRAYNQLTNTVVLQ